MRVKKIDRSAKTTLILLVLILAIGCFLRVFRLGNDLFFSFEQGRDILKVESIVGGDLTLLGPRTNIEGVFHGPFFYYLMVPFYLLFSGHPLGIMVPFILLSLGSIYLLYLTGSLYFNQKVGLLAALIGAVSYEAIVYCRWLSNPPAAFFFSLLLFYSLYRWLFGKARYFLLVILAFAGIFHSEIAAAVFLVPALLICWISLRPKVKGRKLKILALLAFLLSFSSYLLFELRYNFLTVRSVLRFVSEKQNVYRSSLFETLSVVLDRYIGEFSLTVFPISRLAAMIVLGAILLLLLVRIKKSGFFSRKMLSEKILFLWLMSAPPLGLFVWGGLQLEYYLVAVVPGMIIATAFLIDWLVSRKKKFYSLAGVFLFVFSLAGNWYAWQNWLPKSKDVFYYAAQPASRLSQEIKVVDYVYQDAGGQEFSYKAFSIPYNMEHAWEYLFSWYGPNEYDYLPAHTERAPGLFYLILEPGGDELYRRNWIEEVVADRKLLKTAKFNEIIVESYLGEENLLK